ncbi:MAG: bifunctional hydroxymethylpyrimidine kinase/phosphomethylpyrimidine kinase [Kineosporiaceae bacterium]
MIANVLAVAGSDPSGGAGIQADVKAISANGAFAMAALTALTAQNTHGVTGVHLVPPDFVVQQIDTVAADVRIDAVKVGMLGDADIAAAVADALARVPGAPPIVLDPVMVATSGSRLLDPAAVDVVVTRLLPLAAVVTPNLPEAAVMLGRPTASDRPAMQEHADALIAAGARAVLLKGGHLAGEDSPDLLLTAQGPTWLEAPRVVTRNTHGTGCTLSSALAAHVAAGVPLADAVAAAKEYTRRAIAAADELDVGSGHGPTHHFHDPGRRTGADAGARS